MIETLVGLILGMWNVFIVMTEMGFCVFTCVCMCLTVLSASHVALKKKTRVLMKLR